MQFDELPIGYSRPAPIAESGLSGRRAQRLKFVKISTLGSELRFLSLVRGNLGGLFRNKSIISQSVYKAMAPPAIIRGPFETYICVGIPLFNSFALLHLHNNVFEVCFDLRFLYPFSFCSMSVGYYC